jgi:hypothetical protein
MKRQKIETGMIIACDCGILIKNADTTAANLIIVEDDDKKKLVYHYRWICPNCGRVYYEKAPDIIRLDKYEQNNIDGSVTKIPIKRGKVSEKD